MVTLVGQQIKLMASNKHRSISWRVRLFAQKLQYQQGSGCLIKCPLLVQLLGKALVSPGNIHICYLLLLKMPLGRDEDKVKHIKKYLQAVGMFRDFSDSSQDPDFAQV